MKYVLAFVVIAILVRIDVVLQLFDQAREKMGRETPLINPAEVKRDDTPIPMGEDKAMQLNPRRRFLAMLESFKVSPDASYRLQAMQEFKNHPTIFNKSLDRNLEAAIFSWRDLIAMKNTELPLFLVDLSQILQGENKLALQKFFTLLMDGNLDLFLTHYQNTKDTNCLIASLVGENVPEEEKINVLFDREKALNEWLLGEGRDPVKQALAKRCQLVLRLHLNKLLPANNNDNAAPTAEQLPENEP